MIEVSELQKLQMGMVLKGRPVLSFGDPYTKLEVTAVHTDEDGTVFAAELRGSYMGVDLGEFGLERDWMEANGQQSETVEFFEIEDTEATNG